MEGDECVSQEDLDRPFVFDKSSFVAPNFGYIFPSSVSLFQRGEMEDRGWGRWVERKEGDGHVEAKATPYIWVLVIFSL